MNISGLSGSLRSRTLQRAAPTLRRTHWWTADAWSLGLIVLWTLLGLQAVYREPQPVTVDIGSTFARPHLEGFGKTEHNEEYTYAFSGDHARIFVPGAGGGTFKAAIRFNGVRPAGVAPARVTIGSGRETVTFAPAGSPRSYALLTPAASGDLDVRITTNTFTAGAHDQRKLGIPVDALIARPTAGRLPLQASLLFLGLAAGLFALLRRLELRPIPSLVLTLLVLSAGLYGLLATRPLITVGLARWLVVLLGLHLALWPARRAVRAIYQRSGLPLAEGEERWLWRIFSAAVLIKMGGMLYPHIIIFDQAAHVGRMNWILQGRFMELYRPGYTSYMGDTVGLPSGQFPYSPLWYLIVVPFHFLGLSLDNTTNGLSALMDVSKLFPIHLIARATTGSRGGGLLAAALYHLIPMPYFLLSWGNYPTQFGLWASLLATAYLVVHWEQWGSRRSFVLWAAILALSILSYTVLGVFTVTLLGLIALLGLLQRRDSGRKRLRFMFAGLIAAELFCFAIYHVQFANALVSDTLPAIVSGTSDRLDNPLDATAEARQNPVANFAANNAFTVGHFTGMLLALATAGGIMLLLDSRSRSWWPLWGAWCGVFVVYTLISAYIADMVLKHVFFIMPLVCIAAGTLLARWSRRGVWGRAAAALVLLVLMVEVVDRGHYYLLVKRHPEAFSQQASTSP